MQQYAEFKENSFSVSYRWINECIKNQMFMSPKHEDFYIFRPLPMKTPNQIFAQLKFEIFSDESVKKNRIRELLTVLGGKAIGASNPELTHCICQGREVKNVERFIEVRKVNQTVRFLTMEWIF